MVSVSKDELDPQHILVLYAVNKSPHGVPTKTHYQKMMYLVLKALGNDPIKSAGYIPDHFGPYSSFVDQWRTALIDYGYLDKNSEEKRPIASMVKIMTLLLTFDEIDRGNLSLDENIRISEYAAGMGGSQMFLDANTDYKISDLIKGVTVCSANDAATALGERIAGNIDGFVVKMNEEAKNLGMNNTLFCNATGLPNSGEQYSTAKDVSSMFRQLLGKKSYFDYSTVWMEDYVHPDGRVSEMVNTNKLIRYYEGCDAGKTGYTDEAKFCLAASAKKNGMRIVGTILGADNSKVRFKEMSDMFNYAFANYEVRTIIKSGESINQKVEIDKAKDDNYDLYVNNDIKFFTLKGNVDGYDLKIELRDDLVAPVSKETSLGKVILIDKVGNVLCESDIYSRYDIEKQSYKDALDKVLRKWIS